MYITCVCYTVILVPFSNIIDLSACHVQQKYFTLKTKTCGAIQRAPWLLVLLLLMKMEMMLMDLVHCGGTANTNAA